LRLGQKFKKCPRAMDTSGESDVRRPAHVSGKTIRYVMHRTCSCLGDHSNSTFTRLVRRLIPRLSLYELLSLSLYPILNTPYGLLSIAVSVILDAAQHRHLCCIRPTLYLPPIPIPNRGIYALTAVPYDSTHFYDITIPLRLRYTLYPPTYLPSSKPSLGNGPPPPPCLRDSCQTC
jgi:hypothetical protein